MTDRQQRARELLLAELKAIPQPITDHHEIRKAALRAIAQAEADAEARIVQLVEQQKKEFANPAYAGGPVGAFGEIFACNEILLAIRNGNHRLSPENSQ